MEAVLFLVVVLHWMWLPLHYTAEIRIKKSVKYFSLNNLCLFSTGNFKCLHTGSQRPMKYPSWCFGWNIKGNLSSRKINVYAKCYWKNVPQRKEGFEV